MSATTAVAVPAPMLEKHQRWCIWAGLAFIPLFGGAFLAMGWVPPPSPDLSAEEIAAIFEDDRRLIQVCMWVLTAAAPLLAFYSAAMAHQCRMIVGPSTMVMIQVICAACLVLEFIIPQMVWQTAVFRTGKSAETIQTLNDQAWLLYLGVVGTAMVQMVLFALCVLSDPREEPLVPRWSAYLNLWAAVGVLSGGLIVFAHTGPIAWDGVLSWWIVVSSFFVWILTTSIVMLRASRRVELEQGGGGRA